MKHGILTRGATSAEGTLGRARFYEDETCAKLIFECATLELAWHDNARGKSCAPAKKGLLFKWRSDSPKHGACYEEWDNPETAAREDVEGRDCIQIHSANLAGDEDKGFVKQLDGCLALGAKVSLFKGGVKPAGAKDQLGISSSGPTMLRFHKVMNQETFSLDIVWAAGVGPRDSA